MRIARFDGGTMGIVASDDTIVDISGLLQRFNPFGPEDLLPDLIDRRAWWISVFPGTILFLTVLALNLIGDGLRDALDPRTRER